MIECLNVFFIYYIGNCIDAGIEYSILAFIYTVLVCIKVLKPKK